MLGIDPSVDLAVLRTGAPDAARRLVRRGRRRPRHRVRGLRARQPRRPRPARHLRVRRPAPRAACAARAGARSPACIEHTAPLPRGSGGRPARRPRRARCWASTPCALDGGLIVALPADGAARARRRARRAASGRAARAWASRSSPPRAGAPHAPRGRPDPSSTACSCAAVEDGSPADRGGHRARRPDRRGGRTAVDGARRLYAALDAAADGTLELDGPARHRGARRYASSGEEVHA